MAKSEKSLGQKTAVLAKCCFFGHNFFQIWPIWTNFIPACS